MQNTLNVNRSLLTEEEYQEIVNEGRAVEVLSRFVRQKRGRKKEIDITQSRRNWRQKVAEKWTESQKTKGTIK